MRKNLLTPNLRKSLPTLGSLPVFEAAARHLNFTACAIELNVTRVAVSQRIRALEAWLEVRLFERSSNGLKLTPAGTRYLGVVTSALGLIADETQAIRAPGRNGILTISAPTSMITYWLMPKLVQFRDISPELDIRLVVADRLSFNDRHLDLDGENIDVAFRYGDGSWRNTNNTFLRRDMIFPMCAPEYVFHGPRPVTAEDLLNETLILLEGEFHESHTWPTWFASHGVDAKSRKPKNVICFNSYANQIQAALDGQGIALLGQPVVEDYCRKGRLLKPIVIDPTIRHSWYLCTSRHRSGRKITQRFLDWVMSL